MKVILTTSLSGANGAFGVGDEYECSADEGKCLIERGMATPVVSKRAKQETATAKQPRKETRGRGK